MTNTLIQFRVDENLKNEATNIYENIGLDLNSAIKLFLKRSVAVSGLPFSFNLELDEIAKISKATRKRATERAKMLGLSNITMDEIDEEIKLARAERHGK